MPSGPAGERKWYPLNVKSFSTVSDDCPVFFMGDHVLKGGREESDESVIHQGVGECVGVTAENGESEVAEVVCRTWEVEALGPKQRHSIAVCVQGRLKERPVLEGRARGPQVCPGHN